MKFSSGIDAVDIKRFAHWHEYRAARLLRIFGHDELAYCLANPLKSAERFAVRFAAKEAFYKALFPLHTTELPPFLTVIRHVQVATKAGHPTLVVAWGALRLCPIESTMSLTHAQTIAIAHVLLYDCSSEP